MKIAIVNDLTLGVEAMRRAVVTVPGYEVVWIAKDGAEAVEKCSRVRPDIVLMDLLMPVMDGVEATRRIMAESPCAILIVTATVSGNISRVFEAMGCGALDAVCTPVFGSQGNMAGAEPLLSKIKMINVLLKKSVRTPTARIVPLPRKSQQHPLIAIGASTGGPQALAELLSGLPAGFKPAIVIVQHVDALFAPGMAEWLSLSSQIKVHLITNGSVPQGGKAWMACTNDNLVLNPDLSMRYTPEPKDNPYRPSVDVFFESVAKYWPGSHTAVLLTGMGRDGALGLLALRRQGWHTIAQDEKTCVVYGMPKAAAELDAAVEVLPLKAIASRLIYLSGEATQTGQLRSPVS